VFFHIFDCFVRIWKKLGKTIPVIFFEDVADSHQQECGSAVAQSSLAHYIQRGRGYIIGEGDMVCV
jgi:hypothetical protein